MDAMIDLRDAVRDEGFPCLGGKAAVANGTCAVEVYRGLPASPAIDDLAADLGGFVRDHAGRSRFAVHAAIDPDARIDDECTFERYLWEVLTALHARDEVGWDPASSQDPSSSEFRFSFGGRSFYVIGMGPFASRAARRLPHPTLVFNPMWQFDILRAQGHLEPMMQKIRRRDARLQGAPNPNQRFEGVLSDALQYSGRAVDASWQCPFPAR